ncbi:MAG: iron-sulfur cluster assembly accessory protein [bacterium]|nr:iron-sulfur cluster assembly accessory protein [bacterium]
MTQAELLTISEVAVEKIREFMGLGGHEDDAIRLTLVPEARVQDKYQLEFVPADSAARTDVVADVSGLTFVLDPRSAELVRGTAMDYVDGMWSSGFRFESPDRLALMADPKARRVQEVIDEGINPAVAAHGGSVTLVDVRDHAVYLEFGGGCQGCGLAPVTVRELVEKMLKEALPEIRQVVDLTDHTAGENPYMGDNPYS